MPLTKQAIKKMHHDKKVTRKNAVVHTALKKSLKIYRKAPTATALGQVMSQLDKMAKSHKIHKNKASRLKSRLSHLLVPAK